MGHAESYLKTESIKQNSLDMGFLQHGAKCIKSKTIEHQHILNSNHIDSGDTGGDGAIVMAIVGTLMGMLRRVVVKGCWR